jgi:hypothetical protein
MTTTFRNMTVEHLGAYATEGDLAEFQALCEEVQQLHPELTETEVTDAVFGDGDYVCNARKLGVG